MVHGIFRTTRYGSVTFWAWVASIAVHLIVLLVFGVMKFSQSVPLKLQNAIPMASVTAVKKIINAMPVVSKPKIKRDTQSPFVKKVNHPVSAETVFETESLAAVNIDDLAETRDSRDDTLAAELVISHRIEFFGSYSDERKVCFVVDSSGSMKGVLGQVKNKLKKSIQSLQADQYFYIIFFGSDRLFESGNGRLIRASAQAKAKAYDFIDGMEAAGKTNAIVALERAVKIRDNSGFGAAVIYFLTDGFELTNKNNGIVWKITQLLNQYAAKTKINTIGFWPDRNDRTMLQAIARQSGGEFVMINEEIN
ncbi:MAG: VWA domain-containing protein [Planctomycetes bacterium]|nr:VWA domain-containing protein [Planctomycetota bacterium]